MEERLPSNLILMTREELFRLLTKHLDGIWSTLENSDRQYLKRLAIDFEVSELRKKELARQLRREKELALEVSI